eukprot:ANDGO_05140.mRNA.1 GPI ethanolamine phosphate transferase 1
MSMIDRVVPQLFTRLFTLRPPPILIIVIVSAIIHSLFVLSVFDVYFKTPIEHGIKPVVPPVPPTVDGSDPLSPNRKDVAERVVFMVGDGLRADKFFEMTPSGSPPAPFLHSLYTNRKAAFGIQHTAMPTESRPCHTSMFAGIFEDPSAVVTAWKEAPIWADTIFHHVSYGFLFGDYDVAGIFEFLPNVYTETFGSDFIKFSEWAPKYDNWVFDRVMNLFTNPQSADMERKMKTPKAAFFLHLMGPDTSGHAQDPQANTYMEVIRNIDNRIKNLSETVNAYYGDEKTVFVFTADHGMTDKSSHGAGEPETTRTPVVVWGPGVTPVAEEGKILADPGFMSVDEEVEMVKSKWGGADYFLRKDMRQVDMANLVSTLLGTPIPVNSLGIVPLQFLSANNPARRAVAAHTNYLSLLEHVRVKTSIKAGRRLFFSPYPHLDLSSADSKSIQSKIASRDYAAAIEMSTDLMFHAIQALDYLQRYDSFYLMTVVTFGYAGWISFLLLFVYRAYKMQVDLPLAAAIPVAFRRFVSAAAVLFSYLFLQGAPATYYLYTAGAIFCVVLAFSHSYVVPIAFRNLLSSPLAVRSTGLHAGFAVLIVALICAGFYPHGRWIFFVIALMLAVWSQFVDSVKLGTKDGWTFACLLCGCFTFLSVKHGRDMSLVYSGGIVGFVFGAMFLYMIRDQSVRSIFVSYKWLSVQFTAILVSIWIIMSIERDLAAGILLQRYKQRIAWSMCCFSSFSWIVEGRSVYHRLLSIFLSLVSLMILFAVNYEVFFTVVFGVLLYFWIVLEQQARGRVPIAAKGTGISSNDVRTCVFLVAFLFLGIFGTGNFASIASFQVASLFRFTIVYDAFFMAFLLVFKLSVPPLLLSAAIAALDKMSITISDALFTLAFALIDLGCVAFFFLVKTRGSWADIGNSLSYVIIMNSVIFIFAMMRALSGFWMTGVNSASTANSYEALRQAESTEHTRAGDGDSEDSHVV